MKKPYFSKEQTENFYNIEFQIAWLKLMRETEKTPEYKLMVKCLDYIELKLDKFFNKHKLLYKIFNFFPPKINKF